MAKKLHSNEYMRIIEGQRKIINGLTKDLKEMGHLIMQERADGEALTALRNSNRILTQKNRILQATLDDIYLAKFCNDIGPLFKAHETSAGISQEIWGYGPVVIDNQTSNFVWFRDLWLKWRKMPYYKGQRERCLKTIVDRTIKEFKEQRSQRNLRLVAK